MVKIENRSKENPKLEQRRLADGRISLYLEYYRGRKCMPVLDELGEPVLYDCGKMAGKPKYKVTHIREKETLNLYLAATPRTPIERQQNKETLELAKRIRFEREQELLEQGEGYRLKKNRDINLFDFIQKYYDEYTKADIRMIKAAKKRFTDFIALEYPAYTGNISPDKITHDMMGHFVEYLQSTSKGEGAVTHWKRWKKIVRAAVKADILKTNPCEDIICKADDEALKKDILSLEEVEQLIGTKYAGQNQEIRRAFIFTLYTGIRFCDIKDLTFANVDYSNRLLTFNQKKTQGHSNKSYVIIPLNAGLLSLIGKASTGRAEEKIFKLPSQTMCLKTLRRWTAKAGINKHITWHCGRHSFAVNILNNGANIKTVASLLGHSSLKHTEKYTRAVDSLKEAAINSLPKLKI